MGLISISNLLIADQQDLGYRALLFSVTSSPNFNTKLPMPDRKSHDERRPFTIRIPRTRRSLAGAPGTGTKRILVVDDPPGSLSHYSVLLQEAGYEVTSCGGPLAALFAVGRVEPDLVVAELRRPLMNGLALAAELKAHSDTCHIPVVMLAAGDVPIRSTGALAGSFDAYLTGRITAKIFLDEIAKLLRWMPAKSSASLLRPRNEPIPARKSMKRSDGTRRNPDRASEREAL